MAPVRVAAVCLGTLAMLAAAAAAPIPIIIDTDIGTDFDDSAALALAVSHPEIFDIKLVLSATSDTTERATIAAKYLAMYNRTDVPVGVGLKTPNATRMNLADWASDYSLDKYPGTVYQDGISAAIEVINNSTEPVVIVAIAPATNFPMMLAKAPAIVKKASVAAMSGSIYRGYGNSSTPSAEYNVAECPGCTSAMYGAGWPVKTTPLDTCGVAFLQGAAYDTLMRAHSTVGMVLLESYLSWCNSNNFNPAGGKSDVWYDAFAMTLAGNLGATYANFQELNVYVTSNGFTVPAPQGPKINVATTWKAGGLDAWRTFAATSVANGPASPPME